MWERVDYDLKYAKQTGLIRRDFVVKSQYGHREKQPPELDLMTAYLSEIFERYADAEITVSGFMDPRKALESIKQNGCDILFSDIELCGMDGLLLLREVQKHSPETKIVITTAYEEYVVQAVQIQIRLAGYLYRGAIWIISQDYDRCILLKYCTI